METVADGVEVIYNGSFTEYHGEVFTVAGTHEPCAHPEQYPGGVAYVLVGPDRLVNVRRTSFTVVG